MKKIAVCGICRKFVKVEKVENGEEDEVRFVCKKHGDVTSYIEWI